MNNSNSRKKALAIDDDDESFDLKGFLAKLKASWWVFIISIIICGVLAILFMHYKTPAYNITSVVLINDESNNASSGVSSSSSIDLSSLLNLKSNVDNEAAVLQTRRMMEQTVRDMKLNVIYYLRRALVDQEMNRNPITAEVIKPVDTVVTTTFKVFPVDSFRYSINYKETYPNNSTATKTGTYYYGQPYNVAGVGLIRVLRNHNYGFASDFFGLDSYRFDVENIDQRIYELQQLFTVTVTSTTVTTINLVLDYPIPNEGEAILGHLINKYQKQNVQLQNMVADSTVKFINVQLLSTKGQLDSIERNLELFKQQNKLANMETQGNLLLNTNNTYNTTLQQNETELSIIESLKKYLLDETKNKTVVPVSVLPNDPEFAALVETYNNLLIEQQKQSLSVTSSNPFMENLQQRIATLRGDMVKNLNTTEDALKITNNQLKNTTGGFSNQISKIPPLQKKAEDMGREQGIAQQLYVYLLQKMEETEMSKTSNLSVAQVIDSPKADYKPYSPNSIIVGIVAVFFAFVFPVTRIFVKDILNNKILTREDISKYTDVPIIGEISHNKTADNIVVLLTGRSAIGEQFRALRTNLQYFINKADEKVILVTSSMSGEGKSFVSVNLASALAISGKKVVLMELDLRKPKISSYFGIENTNGFSNYIISNDMLPSAIITHSIFHENLYVISSGPIPPNPAELILDSRADDLVAQLKNEFDYVLIDAPPIGLVTDAELMNRFADMSLYIVRQNYTFKEQLNIPDELSNKNKLKKLSIVVNDINVKSSYGYNYGYGYGYGYGYYEEDNKPGTIKTFFKSLFTKRKA